jgi:hypothetical protein
VRPTRASRFALSFRVPSYFSSSSPPSALSSCLPLSSANHLCFSFHPYQAQVFLGFEPCSKHRLQPLFEFYSIHSVNLLGLRLRTPGSKSRSALLRPPCTGLSFSQHYVLSIAIIIHIASLFSLMPLSVSLCPHCPHSILLLCFFPPRAHWTSLWASPRLLHELFAPSSLSHTHTPSRVP